MAKLEDALGTNGAAVEKFLADFEDSPALLARFNNGSLDVHAWEALVSLSKDIRIAPMNIEAAAKLISLAETLKGGAKQKLLSTLGRIIQNVNGDAVIGADFLRLLNSGKLDNIENYVSLVGFSAVDVHAMKSVQQAMKKAEDFLISGKDKGLLRFEDKVEGKGIGYDVDLGVKKTLTSTDYIEVYQFKTNDALLNKRQMQEAASQLYNAPGDKRIVELRLVNGDNLNAIQSNEILINEFNYYLFKKGLMNNSVIIDEFILEFSNGSKVQVTYTNGNLLYTDI